MGDATKLAIAVFLISCSSGGYIEVMPGLIMQCLLPLPNAMHSLLQDALNATQRVGRKGGWKKQIPSTFSAAHLCGCACFIFSQLKTGP